MANPLATAVLSLEQGSSTHNNLLKLADILKILDKLPTLETTLTLPEQATQPYIAPFPRVLNLATLPRVHKSVSLPRVDKPVASPQKPIKKLTSNKLSPPTWQHNSTFKKSRYNLRSNGTNFRSQAAQYLVAQHTFNTIQVMNHIYNDSGKKETLATLLSGDSKTLWTTSLSNEWGRVANGNIFGIKGTQTLEFIAKNMIPSDKSTTYGSLLCDYKPLKIEQ